MMRQSLILASIGMVLTLFAIGAWFSANPQIAGIEPAPPVVEESILVRNYSPILGAKSAPVTIVEFFDPACEACRAFHPIVKGILKKYPEKVRVVVRYTPFHGEASLQAISILEAARMQNLFLPVLEALLRNQPDWASHGSPAPGKIMQIAKSAGLDVGLASVQIKSPSTVGVINQDRADVEAVGVKSTPTFFVNGKPMPKFGRRELESLVQTAVDEIAGQ